jgi:hypothetical protein
MHLVCVFKIYKMLVVFDGGTFCNNIYIYNKLLQNVAPGLNAT